MDYEWDPKKCELNIRLRQLDFSDAIYLFADTGAVIWDDDRYSYGEPRFNVLALYMGRVHAMTFTRRGKVVRIISFRKANAREQRKYERAQNGQSRPDRQ